MRPFCDIALARRLEALSAQEMRRFVGTARSLDAYSEAALLEVAGGVAAYMGQGSPVNQAVGLAMHEPVGTHDIEKVEDFFAERGQRGLAVTCPLADGSLFSTLCERGWSVDGFENVLVRPVAASDADPEAGEPGAGSSGITVRRLDEDDDQRHLWAHVASIGFSAPLEPVPEQLALGRIVSHREGTVLLMGYVNGRPAGTGEVFCEDGVAWLSADTTLPQFRRMGVQAALQRERLRLAVEAGCELAVSEAVPGSPSQRNMERLGFTVAYTRADMISPVLTPGGSGRERWA